MKEANAMSKIFFSYAWGDSTEEGKNREAIVNQLYDSLQKDGYKLVRDKVDLGYKGLISDFMEQIGKGDKIIVVISDKYVRSPYCMFELYEIARNSRFEKLSFLERVFPIMVEYIDFTQPLVIDKYISYWKEKKNEWIDLFDKHIDDLSPQQFDRYDKERLIRNNIGKLMDWMNDVNTLNPEKLSSDNFDIIKKAITKPGEMDFAEVDWDNLVTEINEGRCAIFLGHGLVSGNEGESYSAICSQLARRYPNFISDYYAEDNFFLFKTQAFREKFAGLIESHYKNLKEANEIYRLLAQIPFRLYISISPDNFLTTAFGGNAEVVSLKDIKTGRQQNDTGKPVIYQIFGRIGDSEGLILSHDDQFEFLKNILGGYGLPKEVQQFFFSENASGEVIFLGFDFRKWYMRLFLRIFDLAKPNIKLNRTAYLDTELPDDEKNFASNQFQVEFVEKHIKEFVTILHQKCKERGILRETAHIENTISLLIPVASPVDRDDVKKEIMMAFKRLREYDEKLFFSQDEEERKKYSAEIEKEKKLIEELKNTVQAIVV